VAKQLNAKQIQAAQYAVQGYNQTQIAKMVDVRRETVNNWFKKQEFTDAVEAIRTDIQEASLLVVQNLHDKVQRVHLALLDAVSEKVRLDAVKLFKQEFGLYKSQKEITITDTRKQLDSWLSGAEIIEAETTEKKQLPQTETRQ